MDWAEANIPNKSREAAMILALAIWDEANAEAVSPKTDGGDAGKP